MSDSFYYELTKEKYKHSELRMKTITFDPRILISPPYIKCPKCGKDSFGVLQIYDDYYLRRCRECFYPKRTEPEVIFPLPELNKKIIYIDQFAISNMMKMLNPDTTAYKKGGLDDFWLRLFERLDSLCKLQLIICPYSGFHTYESLLSQYYESLKRMYELLSYNVSFYDYETIQNNQIYEYALNWITGQPEKKLNLDVQSVVDGKINAWQNRLIISVDIKYDPLWIEGLRQKRESTTKELSNLFKQWQSEKDKTFDCWFELECKDFGTITLQLYKEHIERNGEIATGKREFTSKDIFPSSSVKLIHTIHDIFRKAGIKDSDIWFKTIEYFSSPYIKDIPYIKISAMLFAALARKAASGRKKPPNCGMVNDIEIISTLLPYCNAMFIDNECLNYLRESPLCNSINYGTKVFSQNTKDEFLRYLDDIESNASKEHLYAVNEVYGEDWREPYVTIYKSQKN